MYDTAADVTGVLIARATGMSFGDALRERICNPLGTTDTALGVSSERMAWSATAYERENAATAEPIVEDGPDGRLSRPPAFESAGGGLVSTAEDYLAFASTLLAGGSHLGERVLSRPSVTLMTTDHPTSGQQAASGFWPAYFDSMGWGVTGCRPGPAAPTSDIRSGATDGPASTAPPGTTIPPRTCRRSSSCRGARRRPETADVA